VQRRLRSLGYHPGPVDGLYGPRTERAARRFQETRRLRADAVVGPRTLLALRTRDDARRPAATAPPAPAPLPAAVPAPAPRSVGPAMAPERSPFPFATVLAILGVLGLGIAAASYARTRRRVLGATQAWRPPPPQGRTSGEAPG
jgi:peptidoglycan hydrolase-like protein with peptidoglycan-binding domain